MTNFPRSETAQRWHRFALGLFFGLLVLKFGNPCVMERFVEMPASGWEWFLNAWPNRLVYPLLAVVGLAGFVVARWRTGMPKWLLVLPVAWLAWQFVSAAHSVDATLTGLTLKHFIGCVACFYLGLYCLGREGLAATEFWLPVALGLAGNFAAGIEQHFGGLDSTRKYFYTYIYPTLKEIPPEYLKKISSTRIFGTMFYPNALAGIIILLLPPALVFTWRSLPRFTEGARKFLAAALGLAGLACLFWSGSKGGWLILLVVVMLAVLRLEQLRKFRWMIVSVILVAGLAGFLWRYSGFFQRGATSVHARFDYWTAAVQAARQRPIWGSGPGTFGVIYEGLKKPEAEMSRVVHNDYLQQFSDSGLPGGILFLGSILALLFIRPKGAAPPPANPMAVAVALGLLGFGLQSFAEFGFYIPALGWTAACLAGMLVADRWNDRSVAKPGR
ncbi:MAG: O-antigen ligase domain-containing protein [Verrucomicrobia bacterium]|nr:MAG: O-antigen ligase domain-containing protein [Verrucomicrobiota bacterium]